MKFNMIMTFCPTEKHQEVIDAAKAAGATGATLLSARGTGIKEAKTFFGLTLDHPQEAVVMLVDSNNSTTIMEAIYEAANMIRPGNGICFSLPVDSVMGLESQLSVMGEDQE